MLYQPLLHFYFLILSCVFSYTSSLMVHSSALTTQSAMCSESSVHVHQNSRRHVPESSGPHLSSSFPPSTVSPEIPFTYFPPKIFSHILFSEKTFWSFNSQHFPIELPIALATVLTLYMCAFVSCALTY